MSYRLGFKSLVQRFHNRFPEPEYRYVLLNQQTNDRPITVVICNELWSSLIGSGNLQTIKIYHRVSDELICQITGDLTFGIRLKVESQYLPRPLLLFKRPLHLYDHSSKHNKRIWLEGKPKFAKLGAALSSQIHFNFAGVCSVCRVAIGYRDRLCLSCHQEHMAIVEMVSEGGRA